MCNVWTAMLHICGAVVSAGPIILSRFNNCISIFFTKTSWLWSNHETSYSPYILKTNFGGPLGGTLSSNFTMVAQKALKNICRYSFQSLELGSAAHLHALGFVQTVQKLLQRLIQRACLMWWIIISTPAWAVVSTGGILRDALRESERNIPTLHIFPNEESCAPSQMCFQ